MYSIDLTSDFSKFKVFLNSTNSDWVNFVLTEQGAMLVQSSGEIFAVLQLRIARSANESNKVFRVDTGMLKLLAIDGFMEVSVGTDVHIDFLDKAKVLIRSVTMPIHQAFTSTFNERLSVFSASSGGIVFDAGELSKPISIAKATGCFIEVNGGILGMSERDGTVICHDAQGIPDLCLSAVSASKLLQCSKIWGVYRNCVYAVDGNYGIIANQCRSGWSIEYRELFELADKYAAVISIDAGSLFELCKRIKSKFVKIGFDGMCILEDADTVYSTIERVKVVECSPGFKEKDVVLSRAFVLGVVAKLGSFIKIYICKNHLKIVAGKFRVLCRRVKVES